MVSGQHSPVVRKAGTGNRERGLGTAVHQLRGELIWGWGVAVKSPGSGLDSPRARLYLVPVGVSLDPGGALE